jgi:hypothetical protein
LPLSVVEVGEVVIDARAVPLGDIRFEVNGREFSLVQLEELTGEVWYVLDSARLRVPWALDSAKEHAISLTLNLYPPYIPGLTWVTRGTLNLEAPP